MASGKILTLLIIATLLALLGAWVVARSYRASMKRLMKMPLMEASTATGQPAATGSPAPAPVALTLVDNRRAYRRLLLSFLTLTLVMALTRTLITQVIADGPITLKTVATLGAA